MADTVITRADRKHNIDDTNLHGGVSGATENNFVAFDANGLPKDSGNAASDFAAASHNHDSAYINASGGDTMAPKLTISDSAATPPLNVTERSAAPSSPATGDMYLDDGTNTASGSPGWRRYTGSAWEDVGALSGGGGSGDAVKKDITQTAHGLAVGDVIRYNTGTTSWVKAQADTAANSEALGVVEAVTDANNFTVVFSGWLSSGSLTLTTGGNFLDAATAGALTTTKPTSSGSIVKPILFAMSATTAIVNIQAGFEND